MTGLKFLRRRMEIALCSALQLIILIQFSINFTESFHFQDCSQCPKGWQGGLDIGACYLLGTKPILWGEASTNFCPMHRVGAKLAEPKTQAQMNFIVGMVSNAQIKMGPWIGLNDDMIEGVFRWSSDGQIVGKTFWGPGQPDNNKKGKPENCVAIYKFDKTHSGYLWNDFECLRSKLRPICEVEPFDIESEEDDHHHEDPEEMYYDPKAKKKAETAEDEYSYEVYQY